MITAPSILSDVVRVSNVDVAVVMVLTWNIYSTPPIAAKTVAITNDRRRYFMSDIPIACAADVEFFIAITALPVGLFMRFAMSTIKTANIIRIK